jgi:hypothetical protein
MLAHRARTALLAAKFAAAGGTVRLGETRARCVSSRPAGGAGGLYAVCSSAEGTRLQAVAAIAAGSSALRCTVHADTPPCCCPPGVGAVLTCRRGRRDRDSYRGGPLAGCAQHAYRAVIRGRATAPSCRLNACSRSMQCQPRGVEAWRVALRLERHLIIWRLCGGQTEHLDCTSDIRYTSHSCDPNCHMVLRRQQVRGHFTPHVCNHLQQPPCTSPTAFSCELGSAAQRRLRW